MAEWTSADLEGIYKMLNLPPLLVSLLAFALSANALHAADVRPNILFVMADDQAPSAASYAGNPQLRTPNLDRLAREGAILQNAFCVTPVCSASRAELAVSRYGTELGILDFLFDPKEPDAGLDPSSTTWMELLQSAGYATCLSGKWHLGIADRFHPTRQGYDEFFGFRGGGCAPLNPKLERDGEVQQVKGFTADLVTDFALDFIRRHESQPFLVSLHFREPHAPWLPARDEDAAPYRNLGITLPDPRHPDLDADRVKKMTREYYASVASVDRNVGRLLAFLDELKLAESTVVIFTSDHGYNTGHHGLWYKGAARWMLKHPPEQKWPNIPRNVRPNMFDSSLRVPAVVRWPARIKAGSTISQTVTHLDWFPTLLAFASVKPPTDLTIRGRDFSPLLFGENIAWNNDLYAEYSIQHDCRADLRCFRTPDWKLMLDFANAGRDEFYHLARDPHEQSNLIDDPAPETVRIRKEFRQRILEYMRTIHDPLLATIDAAPDDAASRKN